MSTIFSDSSLAVQDAMTELRQERDGTARGLICRYPAFNRAVGKMFRTHHIYGLAGHTGSGKSYLFERLNLDFSNKPIVVEKSRYKASTIERLIYTCHFIEQDNVVVLFPLNNEPIKTYTCNLEIATRRQFQRRLGDVLKMSLAYMRSSKLDPLSGLLGEDTYIKVSDEELKLFEDILNQLAQPERQLFIDRSENLEYIINNVYDHWCNSDGGIPILAIDHMLLLRAVGDDFRLMNDSIRQLIELAKLGFIVFPIAQFNNNYSERDRWRKPENHYPTDNDIYMGGQFVQGVDEMFALIQPSKFKCLKYGRFELPTRNLLHVASLKNREGSVGDMWFNNHLHQGSIPPLMLDEANKLLIKTKDIYEQRSEKYYGGV